MTNTTKSYSERLIEASADKLIAIGQEEQIRDAGGNSAAHGFHENWPVDIDLINPGRDRDLQLAIIEKLDLVHEELSESLGEVRSGRDPLQVYFSFTEKIKVNGKVVGETTTYFDEQEYDANGQPKYKPEGLLVELADADIRIHDLVYLLNGSEQYIKAHRLKREYNTTRPYKHGRTL